jgi:hypothetical protein
VRKLLALSIVVAVIGGGVATNTAHAKSNKAEIQFQQKRFYHADGYIKAIGNVAYRTIYSPDAATRLKWKKAVKWLISVRSDASAKITRLKQPPLPPHYSQWLCIHHYEAAWNDDGAPYWGGLQFGYTEWHKYGTPYTGVDTANLASPVDQMWAAERYYKVSGFYPWPNTARFCGLI